MEHVRNCIMLLIKYVLNYIHLIMYNLFIGPVMLDEFVEWLKIQRGDETPLTEARGS